MASPYYIIWPIKRPPLKNIQSPMLIWYQTLLTINPCSLTNCNWTFGNKPFPNLIIPPFEDCFQFWRVVDIGLSLKSTNARLDLSFIIQPFLSSSRYFRMAHFKCAIRRFDESYKLQNGLQAVMWNLVAIIWLRNFSHLTTFALPFLNWNIILLLITIIQNLHFLF